MHRSLPLPIGLSLLLSACLGGGGGSGGGGGPSFPLDGTPVAFTSFSAMGNNSLVAFDSGEVDDGGGGLESNSINYSATYDPDPLNPTIDPVGGTTTNESTPLLVYNDGSGDAAQARLTVNLPAPDPAVVTDFTTAPVLAFNDDYLKFANARGAVAEADLLALYAPEAPDDLEYMTFGIWALGLDSALADLGAATWGAATLPVNVPIGGTATYNGGLLGTWIEAGTGVVSHWEADSTIEVVDFAGGGAVQISSTNTLNLETGAVPPGGGLNLYSNGLGDWASIEGNSFVNGTVRISADGAATGDFNGGFYGPNAEEAGATFDITFAGGRYFGSLGGKQ